MTIVADDMRGRAMGLLTLCIGAQPVRAARCIFDLWSFLSTPNNDRVVSYKVPRTILASPAIVQRSLRTGCVPSNNVRMHPGRRAGRSGCSRWASWRSASACVRPWLPSAARGWRPLPRHGKACTPFRSLRRRIQLSVIKHNPNSYEATSGSDSGSERRAGGGPALWHLTFPQSRRMVRQE